MILLRNLHYFVNMMGGSLVMHDGERSKVYNRGFELLNDSSTLKSALLRYRFIRTFPYSNIWGVGGGGEE